MWREPSNPGFINYGQGDTFSPFDQTHPLYTHIASLTALRKQLAPLRRGDFQIKWTSERTADEQDAGMLAFERSYNGETVLVVINTHGLKSSTTSATSLGGADMSVSFPSGTTLKSVWGQQQNVVVAADQSLAITLPARSATVLVAQ
jgi:glycosidase